MIKCFFGFHNWECINISPYMDGSWGGHVTSIFYTRVCRNCQTVKEKFIYGCTLTNCVADRKLMSTPLK
jgi:hypothetical protein